MGMPHRANNYIPTGESKHCVYWDGVKGFGKFSDKCRYCEHRPLYTDRCNVEDRLQGSTK